MTKEDSSTNEHDEECSGYGCSDLMTKHLEHKNRKEIIDENRMFRKLLTRSQRAS